MRSCRFRGNIHLGVTIWYINMISFNMSKNFCQSACVSASPLIDFLQLLEIHSICVAIHCQISMTRDSVVKKKIKNLHGNWRMTKNLYPQFTNLSTSPCISRSNLSGVTKQTLNVNLSMCQVKSLWQIKKTDQIFSMW